MHRPQPIPEIPQLDSPPDQRKKSYTEIRKTQTGVRGAIKTLGAWGAIALTSLVGGKVAGEMSAAAVHQGVKPLAERINEAVTPNMCKDEYEGFKGIILGEMDGRIGKMINGVLDSVDMKHKIQKWLDEITKKMNAFREELCSGLKKVPELTEEIDQGVQKLTRLIVRWMTTAMLLMALSMLYRGHKRRSLRKLADDALADLEQELANERSSKEDLMRNYKNMEERVEKLERIFRQQGMITDSEVPSEEDDE